MLFALVSALFIFGLDGNPAARASKARMSKITGTVLDANQARVTDATIKIENARFSLKLQSNDEGKFEAELPAGTYRIIVRKDGFRRFELSPFRARANSSEQVSIRLEVEPPQTPLKVE